MVYVVSSCVRRRGALGDFPVDDIGEGNYDENDLTCRESESD